MTKTVYLWFDKAEDCADSAAAMFESYKWTWLIPGSGYGDIVPNRAQILRTLQRLKVNANGRQIETGRLSYCNGKFGHQNADPAPNGDD